MTADFNVILNFNSAKPVITGAQFKAGDKGFTINMDVRELDPTGMTPKIAFYRSNGTSVESSAVTNVGNIFSYTLLGNELAVPGIVVADLKFYDGDDQRISSASFLFTAIADTLDGLGGGTESYSDELEQLSAEFQDTLDDYIDAFGNTAPINPRGDYDNAATYEPRDMVYDPNTGTSWVCKQESTGNAPTNGSAYWQQLLSSASSSNFEDLANVDISSPTDGQVPTYNGTTHEWENKDIPAGTFAGLTDVSVSGATDGQVPTYNGTSQKWEPVTPSPGGVTSFNTRTGAVSPAAHDYDAADVDYDNTTSGIAATDVQGAIDEVKGLIPTIPTIPEKTSDLADVASTAPTNGQILKYNGTSQKYEPAAESGAGSNQNILINGWFTVNQRGSASYTTAGYTVDRWRTDSAVTITVSAADGVLIGGSYLKQILEASVSDALLGEKVTLSIKYADGTISTGTATIPSTYGAAYTSVCSTADNIGFLQVDQSTDKFRVIIASSAKYVRAVKLEIGSVSTIAQDTKPDYTTELLRCQRYFVRKSADAAYRVFGLVSTDSSTAAGWALPLAVPLRTNPSISYGGSFYIRANGQNYTVTAMATGANQVSAQVQITLTSSGLSVGVLAMFANDSASAYIDINAEL